MLKKININNYKCVSNSDDLKVGKVTILAGPNSSGKSSLVQPLIQFFSEYKNRTLKLNGTFLKLGKYEYLKSRFRQKEGRIKLAFECELGDEECSLTYTFDDPELNQSQLELEQLDINIFNKKSQEEISAVGYHHYESEYMDFRYSVEKPHNIEVLDSEERFPALKKLSKKHSLDIIEYFNELSVAYVSANRVGAKDLFPGYLPDNNMKIVGSSGEFSAALLKSMRSPYVKLDSTFSREVKESEETSFSVLFDEWFQYIFNYRAPEVKDASVENISISFDKGDYPQHVGFGLSYCIPILVQGLCMKTGDVFVVENPEAHIEPTIQSRLMEFIFTLADNGIQVFIETHSDHIINSARVEFLQRKWKVQDLSFWFVKREEGVASSIESIFVNDSDLTSWPEGFFDEYSKNLRRIYENSHKS